MAVGADTWTKEISQWQRFVWQWELYGSQWLWKSRNGCGNAYGAVGNSTTTISQGVSGILCKGRFRSFVCVKLSFRFFWGRGALSAPPLPITFLRQHIGGLCKTPSCASSSAI